MSKPTNTYAIGDVVYYQYDKYSSPVIDNRKYKKRMSRIIDAFDREIRRCRDARLPHPAFCDYDLKPWHLKRQCVAERQMQRGGSWTDATRRERSIDTTPVLESV